MITLQEAESLTGIEVLDYLDRQAEVPVLTGMQRQGDVIVVPQRAGNVAGLAPVPDEGIAVVRGEAGGNTHSLLADGPCMWAGRTATADDPILGRLVVPDGSTAFLAHPEHGFVGIGAGDYVLRRQVEAAEQARLVAD